MRARGRQAPHIRGRGLVRGFTLIELAVAIVILGLLLGGLVSGLGALRSVQQDDETRQRLEEIREALITFAVVNRRLPCPATPTASDAVAGAGVERAPTAAGCTGGAVGVLPWATLGLPQTDSWGRRFTYRVALNFARTAPAITLASTGDITVQNRSLVAIATQMPAVVVSHGANARGSRNHLGALAPAGTNASELENSDGDAVYVADSPVTGFDDQAMWVPTTVLMGRMLQAGSLP
jgi:prepilin-type N-terminal cleavage/methylation domain-containing protein